MYFRNTEAGRKAAQEFKDLHQGKQEVVLIDEEIPPLQQMPVPRFRAVAKYPAAMKAAGIQGRVVLDVIIDEKGDVFDAVVVASSDQKFDDAAVEAVRRWKFRPARRFSTDVRSRMQVPMDFVINRPNQALVPKPASVTPAADAPVAPGTTAAHLSSEDIRR
jgi:TonB family protein